jgi:hypothetical protein
MSRLADSAATPPGPRASDQFGDSVRGLQASGCVDQGVVAHQSGQVMAEPFGDLVDAVAGVEQARRDQMPDLVRSRSGGPLPPRPVGRIGP